MRYKIEKKKLITFLMFCIYLLYLVPLLIANINHFVSEENLTLNPSRAFFSQLWIATICTYFMCIIAILAFNKKLFVKDKKGGFGLKIVKSLKEPENKFATEKEFKGSLAKVNCSDKEFDKAGIPLWSDGKEAYVDDSEYHSLVIGSTGSGKSTRLVFPMINVLAKKGESMIMTDPKGEVYEKTGNFLRDKGYNVIIINLRDPDKGNAWNPLRLPYQLYLDGDEDKAIELLDDLALNIMRGEGANKDPFWEGAASDYFTGLALSLFQNAKPSEINLNSINIMATVGDQKFLSSNYMKEYFKTIDETSVAYLNASTTIFTANETKQGIMAVFKQKIKTFSSKENLSKMLATTDFNMKDIGKEKTAVYIVVQDEKKTYHGLVTIFLKQLYETLIDVAQENGMKLPIRTNFILDEFANMPPLKDIDSMISAARSRLIRYTLIIQNFSQLSEVYGKDKAETIKSNCGNLLFLMSTELATIEEISKLAGETKKEIKVGETKQIDKNPLLAITELQRLKQGEVIVLRQRARPFKTKLVGIWEYDFNEKTYEETQYPNCNRAPVDNFDIKAFVKEQNNNKLNEMLMKNETNPFSNSTTQSVNATDEFKTSFGKLNTSNIKESKPSPVKIISENQARNDELDELKKRINEKMNVKNMNKVDKDIQVNVEKSIVDNAEVVPFKDFLQTMNENPKPVNKQIMNNQEIEVITDEQFFDDFFMED
ncbi:MAG: VirD4-like conjugal transfer protein, CD1115 family [Bacilli bacterium]